MALSSLEKAKVRLYLGFASFWRYLNPRLEGSLATVDNDLDVETLVRATIADLDTTAETVRTMSVAAAGLKRVDDVEYFKGQQLSEVRSIGRMHAGRLSILTGVPIENDFFSEAGYGGDPYLGGNGNGSTIKLG